MTTRDRGRSPALAKRWIRAADLVAHPARHLAMLRAIGHPALRSLRRRQPRLGVKYLQPFHLAIGLSTAERAAAMIHHYRLLVARLPPVVVAAIGDNGRCLWAADTDAGRLRIDLVFSHPTDNEGELTLELLLDDTLLAVCAFTFVPGSLIGVPDATIVAVTRVQGVRDEFTRVNAAIRSLRGLSPAAVLIAAAAGMARALDITTMAGVTAEAQVARLDAAEPVFPAVYDTFFGHLGGVMATPQFFRIALPLYERPLGEIARNRARTRAQRELKAIIADAAAAAIGPAP